MGPSGGPRRNASGPFGRPEGGPGGPGAPPVSPNSPFAGPRGLRRATQNPRGGALGPPGPPLGKKKGRPHGPGTQRRAIARRFETHVFPKQNDTFGGQEKGRFQRRFCRSGAATSADLRGTWGSGGGVRGRVTRGSGGSRGARFLLRGGPGPPMGTPWAPAGFPKGPPYGPNTHKHHGFLTRSRVARVGPGVARGGGSGGPGPPRVGLGSLPGGVLGRSASRSDVSGGPRGGS